MDWMRLVGAGVAATLFGVYADLAYNCYSATNSSPQTTELFAGERSETLWKYVVLGDIQVAALAGVGFAVLSAGGQKGLRWWPVIGAGTAAVAMHLMYVHALHAGKGKTPPSNAA